MTSATKIPLNMSDKQIYKKKLPQVRWEHLIAGVSGGVVSTLVLHPLDLVKVRFQVNEGQKSAAESGPASIRPQYRSTAHAFKTIFKQQGVRGLYQGVTPNVWGAGASWGLYFFFYSYFKSWLQDRTNKSTLSAGQHMLAAAEAGVTTLVITNPIWVAKTRLCLQYDQPLSATTSNKHYTGMVDCLIKTARNEGVRGLYKGFLPGVFGVSHGALQFMAYEELKKKYKSYRDMTPDSKFNSLEYITFAALSKIFAATATYPYQVVRSRLQDQHRQYRGLTHVIMQIWRHEKLSGFYKGLAPGLIRVTPACCITFLVYEHMMSMLLPHHTT